MMDLPPSSTSLSDDELAAEIIRDQGVLAGDRGNFESHWQEIAERVIPAHSRMFQNSMGQQTKGDKRNEKIFDSTASQALNRFGAILDSLLTPRNQSWHRIKPSDPSLMKNRRVRLWFEDANGLLLKYRYAPKANFSSQNQKNYKSLGAYGTSAMFIDELEDEPGLRYKSVHLSQCYLRENHQGIIDSVHRYFPLSARQAFQKWGEKCPERLVSALKTNPETPFFFIHCVKANHEYDPRRLDAKGKPWASYYVSVESQKLMQRGGYTSFPYAVSRYDQEGDEVYGRSPAMDVLPAIKTLNEEKKTVLKQGHRIVDPVLLAFDDGVIDGFSLKPGALNPGGVSADGRALVQALPVGNIAIGKELMDDERSVINDAFLVTLFQILAETPTMTATEVLERTREKGILLAPTVGRQQSEYLGPMIERELDVLARQGLLPPMPQELLEAQGEYSIEYDSPLSRAQRAEEAAGLMRSVEMALNIVNVTQNPEPLDLYDWDVIMPEISEINGVPARWMKDLKAVQALREGRAQQQQQQQLIQAAPGAAAMIKATAAAKKTG